MNRAAIEELYRRYGPMVLRRARAILHDEQAAMDAMHEVFLRVLRAGAAFRGDASPITWLYRITTNHCLNQIRNETRRRELSAENAPAREQAAPLQETRFAAEQLLQQVPPELGEVAIYHYVDGMSHAEIATVLGVSRRTVGNRLATFLGLARTTLEPAKEMNPQ